MSPRPRFEHATSLIHTHCYRYTNTFSHIIDISDVLYACEKRRKACPGHHVSVSQLLNAQNLILRWADPDKTFAKYERQAVIQERQQKT